MTDFAARFRALVAGARERPGDAAGLAGLAEAAAEGVLAGPAMLEAGFELDAGADAADLLKSRLLARQVDRVLVARGAPAGELLALARALAAEGGAVPSTPAVAVEMVEVIRPGSGPPAGTARERPQGIQLLGDEGVLPRRARPRTGLGREMEALARAVEAAARRRQWVEALHAAQALVRMEHRFPEVERRGFMFEVRRVLVRPILDGIIALALRMPEEQDRAAEVLRWLGAPGADAMVDHVKAVEQAEPGRFLHEALATMPAAVPLLLPLLDGDAPAAARHAADLLGRLRAASAIPGLARLAAHPDPRPRHAAIDALGSFADRRAAEALHRALGHAEGGTRARAAAALGRLGPAAAMPLLAALERE
ncbi:MAG TPA: HEAT repeat domain-containing protein, partial [Gemmatimonadales bacterium]|nr:HEAT repeat domain-containing protein [Gemmatimonadales bacterium]